MEKDNPFTLSVYAGPAYFCDRIIETEKIISAIENHRNITLISHRRMGKSGLIKHVFHKLRNEKKLSLFYIDIMDTEDLSGFINLIAKEIIGKVDKSTMNVIKVFSTIVKSLRPKISIDQLTGSPQIEISVQHDAAPEQSLTEIFEYLQKQEKHVIIALDEFQQITNYPEKNVEAMLRKSIQQLSNSTFIFSGSQKHLLLSMFSNYGRPFYQSSELLNLLKIDKEIYKTFILSAFKKTNRTIDQSALKFILNQTQIHTFYVQYLCNKLYSLPQKDINEKIAADTLLDILEENEVVYFNYKTLLTRLQFKLLEAIAKERGISKPTSKDFIGKYKLGTPSSVKTALVSLLKKEMVYLDESKTMVYDIFFAKWLERRIQS
ncbi:MAG: ATP-binding protein [Bacteroidetes bacterium]|nr:ATP-binding protein [Bacteroidota bacterium]